MSTSTPSSPRPLRILFLHGYTQSPHLFHAKTGALRSALSKAFPSQKYPLHCSYVHAPHRIPLADIPGASTTQSGKMDEQPEAYGWWRRKDRDGGIVYEGLEEGMGAVAKVIREDGPFHGVIGFSQGAAAAGMVASLLEGSFRLAAFRDAEKNGGIPYPRSFLSSENGKDFIQPPLNFAISYSGFRAPGTLYNAFYEPKISTPVLHVLGQVDVVVEESRGRAFVDACEEGEGRVVVHPGGHFVPSQKRWLDAVVGFVRECIEGKQGVERKEEVRVEDMDMPF